MRRAMTDRERFLKTYYFATFMSGSIAAFLLMPTEPEYDREIEVQQYHTFVKGAAGVTSALLMDGDAEIQNGIRLLQWDLREGYRYAVCPDPLLYYQKQKAIAAICRPYFYRCTDTMLVRHIRFNTIDGQVRRPAYPNYSELPEAFTRDLLHYWLPDALTLCDYHPETLISEAHTPAEWVARSFLSPALRDNWERRTKMGRAPYARSFLDGGAPLTAPLDRDIFSQLERETERYAPFRDDVSYYEGFYGLNR